MSNNDWKSRLNVVYSTNPEFKYETDDCQEEETLPKNQQKLRVQIEKHGRGGKTATIIRGFIGTESDIKELAKLLKMKCGVGGSCKDDEIIIQGNLKEKIISILQKEGYTNSK